MQYIPLSIEVFNYQLLGEELAAALGTEYIGITSSGGALYVVLTDCAEDFQGAINSVLSSHNPNAFTAEQLLYIVVRDAEVNASNIPNWATWGETQAVAYIDTNVTDLASAKVVLIALARMVIALRDAQWPQLGA